MRRGEFWRVPEAAPAGVKTPGESNPYNAMGIVALLPDSGERYLSTPMFQK